MEIRFPWETEPLPLAPPAAAAADAEAIIGPARPRKPRGRRPAAVQPAATPGAALWRYHHLTISGPHADTTAFAAAARGPGVVLWQLDYAAIEADIFRRAVSQPAGVRDLSMAGCRLLARQFRDRIEARHARAVSLIGVSRACPFDLQVLLPIPTAILRLGPTHPAALAWLSTHWGITDAPRQVVKRPRPGPGRRLPAGHTVIGYGFFAAAASPRVAIATIAQRWPRLRFGLRQRPLSDRHE